MLRMPSIPNRRKFLRGVINIALLPLLLYGLPAWADNIEQLRASGAIGEVSPVMWLHGSQARKRRLMPLTQNVAPFISKKLLNRVLVPIKWVKFMQ